MNKRRGPLLIEHEPGSLPPGSGDDGASADFDDAPADVAAMQVLAGSLARPASWFARLAWTALLALAGIVVSVRAWDFAAGLLARNALLAQATAVLMAIVALALALLAAREIAAFARLRRVDRLQADTRAIRAGDSRALALALLARLDQLYASRQDLRWGRADLAQGQVDLLDSDALLDLAETALMTPLDAAARRRIEAASRQVAAVTALVPLAFADVAMALFANVRMVRAIAEIYGGRAGFFGSWRLLRAVATHLVATGAVAIGDDMIGSVAGGGVLAKISRRFGEGVINGALTARVGIAAMEVCRPMPFLKLKKPGVTAITGSALKGLFASGK